MEAIKRFSKEYSVVLVLLVIVLFMGLMKPNEFLSLSNMFTILRQVSILGILTVGMLFAMVAGGIDLSVGSMVSFTCVLAAVFMSKMGWPPVLAIIATLLVAMLIGLAMGTVIVKSEIFPMIGTLAVMTILGGFAYLVAGGKPVSPIPESVKFLAQGYISIVPVPVIILLIVLVVAAFVLNRTYIGRYFYLVGSNEEASRLSGIPTDKVKILSYMICSTLAGLGGVIMMSRVSSGQPNVGLAMEMDVLTAAVIGGVSLMGGEGKIGKAFSGVLLLGVLLNAMTILNISEHWQMVVKGTVFLAAVTFAGFQHVMARRKKRVAQAA
ncbi:MAG: ABC transporter permease [Scrofimicrobium sp.]